MKKYRNLKSYTKQELINKIMNLRTVNSRLTHQKRIDYNFKRHTKLRLKKLVGSLQYLIDYPYSLDNSSHRRKPKPT